MNDNKILLLLKNKPSQGLYEATKKYGGMVEAIISRILFSSAQDIEECVADTFVTLWRKTNNIDFNRGSLKGYIATIARSTAIDRYRKLKRQKTDYLQDQELVSSQNIEEHLAIKCDAEILVSLINDMGEPDKEIFSRRFFLFEKVKEIASYLGLSEKSVESRIYRGKKRLKQEMSKRGATV